MKLIQFLILTSSFLIVNLYLFAEEQNNQSEIEIKDEVISVNDDKLNTQSQIVYICTGSYSYAYHSKQNCPGLINCKSEIKFTDENSAVDIFKRKPCCRCWINVSSNCHDDNLNYNGGSNDRSPSNDSYAIIGLTIVATSAIILSNDLYLYPTISFYTSLYAYKHNIIRVGKGFVFGFRKTFKHSALEYGLSYLSFTSKFNSGSGNSKTLIHDRWGIHFNFVHQIFYNKTPEWLKIYFGPSINRAFNLGYGGIIGSEIRLYDRLKFDFRYELTTLTNQIQAGLIFNYQKKYFWQKNK
jgi:hypothetical protein